MKPLSIVMGCYNEQDNLLEVYERVMAEYLPDYSYPTK